MGATDRARRSCSSETLHAPMWRIFPSACSSVNAPIDSSIGTRGSSRCSLYDVPEEFDRGAAISRGAPDPGTRDAHGAEAEPRNVDVADGDGPGRRAF